MKYVLVHIFLWLAGTIGLCICWNSTAGIKDIVTKPGKTSHYPEKLTGAFTGGFSEKTCRNCHFDYDLNPPEGSLSLRGLTKRVEPGTVIDITIILKRPEMGAAGFQLAARYRNGEQAGRFDISDNTTVQFTGGEEISEKVQYIQHSPSGVQPLARDSARWQITWKAPTSFSDTIKFNISANAGNGDQSEFGDWIYSKEFILLPSQNK